MSNPTEEFPYKRFTLNSRPSRRPSSHCAPSMSAMGPVSQMQDWHAAPLPKQYPAAASRQRQYNPNSPPSPPNRQRQGGIVANTGFPRTHQASKQVYVNAPHAMSSVNG